MSIWKKIKRRGKILKRNNRITDSTNMEKDTNVEEK